MSISISVLHVGRATLPATFGIFAFVLAPLAGGAHAAVKKVRPWQKYVNFDCTAVSSSCSGQFAQLGNKRRLEITNVSCFVSVNNTGVPLYVRLRRDKKSGGSEYDHYVPVPTDENIVGEYSAVNDNTRFVVGAGDSLTFQTGAENDILAFSCKAAGELTVFK